MRCVTPYQCCEGLNRFFGNQNVEAYDICKLVIFEFVVHGSITTRYTFEFIIKISNKRSKRNFVVEHGTLSTSDTEVFSIFVTAFAFGYKTHDVANKFLGSNNIKEHPRFFNVFNMAWVG